MSTLTTLNVPSRSFATFLAATLPRIVRNSIAIVVFVALWEALPRLGWVDATFLPPFSVVVRALIDMLASGELTSHLLASGGRALAGFVIAIAIGVPLGLVTGWYRSLADVLNPLLEVFRNTAPLAILPVFVLVLGMGETSKISMVVYSCVWPVLLNTVSGVRNVDPLLIRSARSMGLSPFALFYKVVLPASIPTVFTGIRVAGAYSILVLIAAEMVGAKAGLGYLVNYSQFTFEIPKMYAGIITLSLLGLAFNQAILIAERRLTSWKG
ncbi:ABC transporter permease [Paraburkholderia saeva]|uniref:ABC transporter permease n=1 Tax=Paraburkholderia saeva TaxID=2777537 RepID=UPI001D869B19|nr:ABC transporter permease [Paraburkholderia saeva]CAG4893993.1 Putative aliphatic sulfonates transport permease protein SsuC [Paraburkholderia saeva]